MSDTPAADTTTDYTAGAIPAGKYLVSPYDDWARSQGVPIVTGATADLLAIETRDWPRFDCRGAAVHLDGRCDFLTLFVYDIAPGHAPAPQRHLYDELVVVLAGSGETEFWLSDGTSRIVQWQPGSILCAPSNIRYRHRNTGVGRARLACFNDLRYLLGLYRSEAFIFDNPVECDQVETRRVTPRHDAQAGSRGSDAGAVGACIVAAEDIGLDGNAAVTPARRRMQGGHLLGLGGEGITLSWRDEASGFHEVRWRHGVVAGLPGMHFHQHGSIGEPPARALDIQLGTADNPIFRSRRHHYGDTSVHASGSAEIPRGSEPAAVVARWQGVQYE